jgi:hypothetical protein
MIEVIPAKKVMSCCEPTRDAFLACRKGLLSGAAMHNGAGILASRDAGLRIVDLAGWASITETMRNQSVETPTNTRSIVPHVARHTTPAQKTLPSFQETN